MPRKSNYSTEIVLDKAIELAREGGIDSVTYNGLARELGMRPQSMYRYVPDLKALRVALLGGFQNELVDKIAGATEGLAPVDALRTFAVALYDECHANRCYYESFALMHRYEIRRLQGKLKEKGLTMVPLRVYFKNSLVKVEIGLARGKKLYDKRQDIAKKDTRREAERDFKTSQLRF